MRTTLQMLTLLIVGCFLAEQAVAAPKYRTSQQEDALVACMAGWAAVALTKQGKTKDIDAAQASAATHCRHIQPPKQSYEEGETMGDAIYGLIRLLANGMSE